MLVVVFVLLSATTVMAQEVAGVQFFPIVARTAGVGTSQWVTDLTVHNAMDQTIEVGLQFFPANQTNTFDLAFPTRITLSARETRLVDDVLATIFGYDTDIKGALIVAVDEGMIPGNPEDAQIAAVTRTYNAADPAGTYGQTVPSLAVEAVDATPLIATGARNDAVFRSNVGVVAVSMGQMKVHIRILGPTGSVIAEVTKTIPAFSVKQWSFQQLGVGSVDGALTVEVSIDPSSVSPDPCGEMPNAVFAYVSKVDNGTGDAEFLYLAPSGEEECGF